MEKCGAFQQFSSDIKEMFCLLLSLEDVCSHLWAQLSGAAGGGSEALRTWENLAGQGDSLQHQSVPDLPRLLDS